MMSTGGGEENSKVTMYKQELKEKAEKILHKDFPNRICTLDALVNSPKFSLQDLSAINVEINIPVPEPVVMNNNVNDQPPRKKRSMEENSVDGSKSTIESVVSGTKVYHFPNGQIPCNKHIVEMVNIVKPHIRQLVEDTNVLKMWLIFLIPRIEDGNNFGVQVQEDTLTEIRTVEGEAGAFFDQMSRYYMTRAKIVSKVAKYPHVEDFRRTIAELDEKEYLSLRLVLCELRNHYASLHDLITKNLEKIKKPRNVHTESMY